jgi:hypothetical protein
MLTSSRACVGYFFAFFLSEEREGVKKRGILGNNAS